MSDRQKMTHHTDGAGGGARELYRSGNLSVRAAPAADRVTWVVTFDHYHNDSDLDRPGFGEEFLASYGISAIHFVCKGNDWFQYDDMMQACRTARAALFEARRILAYGSSMGAYAAIRFADLIGAHAVLALAPQYSIDPAKVPWETRWLQDGTRIRWREALDGSIRCKPVPFLIYDPMGNDLRHADRIAQDIAILRIPLPLSGHPVTTYLSDTGLLHPLLLAAIDPDGDPVGTIRAGLKRRKTSSFYLAELARAQPAWRLRTGMALAQRAVALQEAPLSLLALAQLNSRTGQHPEAAWAFERIMALTDRDPSYIYPYAEARYAAGDLTGALALAEETIAGYPDRSHLLNWQAGFLWETGARAEAIAALERAVALDPNPAYAERLAEFRRMWAAENVPSPTPKRGRLSALIARLHGWVRAV